MSKKKQLFILATSTCGYCKMLRSRIETQYPDFAEDMIYHVYGVDKATEEVATVLEHAHTQAIRGVPFTVLLEDGKVSKSLRGYDVRGLDLMLSDINKKEEKVVISESKNLGKQLELFENED